MSTALGGEVGGIDRGGRTGRGVRKVIAQITPLPSIYNNGTPTYWGKNNGANCTDITSDYDAERTVCTGLFEGPNPNPVGFFQNYIISDCTIQLNSRTLFTHHNIRWSGFFRINNLFKLCTVHAIKFSIL